MQPCELCGTTDVPVSEALGVCRQCIKDQPRAAREIYHPRRVAQRRAFGLPLEPPQDPSGVLCTRCQNRCRIASGHVGFCGVRRNEGGAIIGGDPEAAMVTWYRDPLPTNCVADGVCAERHARSGHNLAVFYYGCSFDCLYCQNWRHKQWAGNQPTMSAEDLAGAVRSDTSCLCYFGGDPTPHLPHSLEAARRARVRKDLRVCWETNGSMDHSLLERITRMALETGGTVKVDFKAWDPLLHTALCGVPNVRVLETLRFLASLRGARPDPPLLVASTLLVPGYITSDEVGAMAGFLATLGCDIPYRLLCFAPQHAMADLPTTSTDDARGAFAAAKRGGLVNVGLGNVHLLKS